ncbi:MAG TPA: carbon monoxide dehydrogenase subunit G [Acetobacteraceae bacterium]
MDMTGERRIPAPRKMVWDALNDPEVLKTCIPGCEKLEVTSPQDMQATAAVRIGPIAARFNGKVHLSDIDEPNGYTISGEGQGGVAGFAKGGAKVHLADEDPVTTILTYEVQAQVGGKIAQLGARLIDSTAKSLADTFFNNMTKELTLKMGPSPERAFPSAPSAAAIPVSPAAVPRTAVNWWAMMPREPMGYPLAVWIGGILWILIFFLIIGPLL